MVLRKPLGAALIAATLLSQSAFAVDSALQKQEGIDKKAAESQQRIDTLADQAVDNLQAYRTASARLDSLLIYNRQMEKLLASQEGEIDSIKRQTAEIDNIETGALPLMLKMTDTLTDLIAADVPFLIDERRERVENLKALIDRADVTAGEKYRRIMEAYLIELEYGRTIEAYRGDLVVNNEVRSVDFFKVGRTGLYYQTLDGGETGFWNLSRGAWELLGSEFRISVRDGLRMARKQMPPELLTLPVNAPAQ